MYRRITSQTGNHYFNFPVELRCSAGGFGCVALQCGFAVGCEDSEDTGFCPLRIMWCAPEQDKKPRMPILQGFPRFCYVCWLYFGSI